MSAPEPRDQRAPGSDDYTWYFAYGANMSTDVFVRRRGMSPLSSEAARLDGYRLTFTTRGLRFVEPVFANIEQAEGVAVHGVLHRLAERDLAMLDRDESSDYHHLRVEVSGEVSGRVDALAYQSGRRVVGRNPSRRYLALLQRGAEEFGLPDDYRRLLAAHPSQHIPLLSQLSAGVIRIALPVRRMIKKG